MAIVAIDFLSTFHAVRRAILGINRYQVSIARGQIRTSIDQLRNENPSCADYLQILADYSFGDTSYESAIERLKQLVDAPTSSALAAAHAYSYLAKLTLKQTPIAVNYGYRVAALELARRHHFHLLELVVLANWTIAALELDDQTIADEMSIEALKSLSKLPQSMHSEPEVDEVRGRLNAIRGKILLRKLAPEDNPETVARKYGEAKQLYDKALSLDQTNAHRQVNTRVEFALASLSLPAPFPEVLLASVAEILEEAHAGLDAHQCDSCRAFYYEAKARAASIEGAILRTSNSIAAIKQWSRGVDYSRRRQKHLAVLGHPEEAEAREMTEELEQLIARERRPRKIFLSHSGKDKPSIRQFSRALSNLGYEPWLDEEAMTAGALLERGLREGMAQSCAAVFFITPEFVDRDYIATEIDYAIEEKRKKGKHFAIITLVLATPNEGIEIPDLLRRFVWKEPKSDLEALVELVRALPLEPVRPIWREE